MTCYNCEYHRIKTGFKIGCVFHNEIVENPWEPCEEFKPIESVMHYGKF